MIVRHKFYWHTNRFDEAFSALLASFSPTNFMLVNIKVLGSENRETLLSALDR